jgi:hypothetical protein
VKWHIIKDVPFTEVCHIALDNDGNQSIIYGRDVQQVEWRRDNKCCKYLRTMFVERH